MLTPLVIYPLLGSIVLKLIIHQLIDSLLYLCTLYREVIKAAASTSRRSSALYSMCSRNEDSDDLALRISTITARCMRA